MSSNSPTTPVSRKLYWVVWVISVLPSLMFVAAGATMLSHSEQAVQGFEKYGYPEHVLLGLGITVSVSTAMYLIPNTSVLGAIFLTGYLGGATARHVRASAPFFIPIIVGALVWLGLLLRDARLRELLPLRR
jgi:hypothetical protein